MRTPYADIVEEVVEELAYETGGSVDRYKQLVMWIARKVDLSGVDSQATLIRWMDRVIDEEAERLQVDRRDYERRFKGLIKFLRDPHLAWRRVVVPYQIKIAEQFISDITERGATAKTLKDYQDILQELRDFTLPPAAEPVYKAQIDKLRKNFSEIVRVLQRASKLAEKYLKEDLSKLSDRDLLRAERNIRKVRRYIQARFTALDVVGDLKAAEERLSGERSRRIREFVRELLERRRRRMERWG